MYLMFVARGYPSEKYPLNGVFEFDQAKALTEQGCKVVYAAVDVRSIRRWRKWGLERKVINGVIIYAINIPCGRIGDELRAKIEFWGLKYLYRIIEKEQGRPDLIHAHFFGIGYLAARLKQATGLPLVITEHSSMLAENIINTAVYKKAREAYRAADCIVAVSPFLKRVLAENFKVDAVYIPNMYDTRVFSCRKKSRTARFRFITVGSLINRKRMALLITAFHRFSQERTDAGLYICGEGSERKQLELLITEKDLTDRIKLLGYQSREAIAELMNDSDCFVLASVSETFGVVYIEALACGLPVIATRSGGPELFIHKDNGILVPIDDIDALAEAMGYVYNNADKYKRVKIAAETKLKFGPESVVGQLIELYGVIKHEKG